VPIRWSFSAFFVPFGLGSRLPVFRSKANWRNIATALTARPLSAFVQQTLSQVPPLTSICADFLPGGTGDKVLTVNINDSRPYSVAGGLRFLMTTPSSPQNVTLSRRLESFVVESLKLLAVALASLVVIGLALVASAKAGIVIPARWLGLFYWTCALLWFICRQYKSNLRHGKFWVVLLTLLALHVGAFAVVLRSYPEWRMAWFMPIFLIEAPLVMAVLRSVVHTRHHR
jgi:hypothetical protein